MTLIELKEQIEDAIEKYGNRDLLTIDSRLRQLEKVSTVTMDEIFESEAGIGGVYIKVFC